MRSKSALLESRPRRGERAPATDHLHRQALAALVAAPLEHVTSGARQHARPESVRTGALALLWLVGPLHGKSSRLEPESASQYTQALAKRSPLAVEASGRWCIRPRQAFSRALRQRPTRAAPRRSGRSYIRQPG